MTDKLARARVSLTMRQRAGTDKGVFMAADWDDPWLGTSPGLGSERPGGAAELKPGLDPGLAVVRYLHDDTRVDARWCVREPRGYRWWGHRLSQRVWSEPGLDDHGVEVFRVVARTDVVSGIQDHERALSTVDAYNAMSSGSAVIVDEDSRSAVTVASVWVHAQSSHWVARMFSLFAALQIAQAEAQADLLAPLLGGVPAATAHPGSGWRTEPDEMLGLPAVVASAGQEPSRWAGHELTGALDELRGLPIVSLASGDETGMALQVPYRGTDALIQLDTREAHPGLGWGLLVRCLLPGGPGPGPVWANLRNRQELASLTRAHFLGSWVGSAAFATFVAFYPNLVAGSGMSVQNIALSTINRVRWLATFGRDGT